jgi:hypothetical protein
LAVKRGTGVARSQRFVSPGVAEKVQRIVSSNKNPAGTVLAMSLLRRLAGCRIRLDKKKGSSS